MHAKRWMEMSGLFVVLPLVFWWQLQIVKPYLLHVITAICLLCLLLLLQDKSFKRIRLWNWHQGREHLSRAMVFFIPLAIVAGFLTYKWLPETFLDWPYNDTPLWLMTLLLYPIFSVIPQEIIYRTFFFHRYKSILPKQSYLLSASALLFGLAHGIYGNWLAVVLSAIGGVVFGYRYTQSRSTAVVVIEHSLWGCFLFTIGLGSYLSLQHVS